jgi:glutamine amidotransferase
MARLFGLLANRPDLAPRVLAAEARLVDQQVAGEPLGWGAGFYQGGEVLLRRRPVDERRTLPLAEALRDVRTNMLIGHVRHATVGTLRTENTHPFRYRQWLFAHTGTIAAFSAVYDRLVESIPQFLRRNVKGDTDSELLFHLFLSFLHDGGRLDLPQVEPIHVREALRSSLALVDRLSAEEGAEPASLNLLVTDGEHLVAVHRQQTMAYRVYEGRHDLEELLGDEGLRRSRVPDAATFKASLLVADVEGDLSRFTPVADASILTLTRALIPAVEPL